MMLAQCASCTIACLVRSAVLAKHSYDVIPLVSSMNAVSRFTSSSLNSVSLWPAPISRRRQIAVIGHVGGDASR